jgi:ferritin-like metal-binding protein YciE
MNAIADKTRDTYIAGLRNQHAVENQAIELLERQIGRLENYPEMRERMQRHLEETREQAHRIEELLSGFATQPLDAKRHGHVVRGQYDGHWAYHGIG